MKVFKYFLLTVFLLVIIFSVARAADINLGVDVLSGPGSGGAPVNVTNFKAEPSDTQIKLTWENPTSDFQGVRIQRKTDYYPLAATDGDNIYDGAGTSFTDTGLVNGIRYYYTAFSYNKPSEYSSGAIASAIPWVTQLQEIPAEDLPVLPETQKTKEEPGKITKKGDIEFNDFQFFVKQDLGWVQVPLLEKNHFFTGEEFLISIPKDIFLKEVSVIIFTLGPSSYLLAEKDGSYQTVVTTPDIKGDYNVLVNIVYQDGSMSTVEQSVLIDPYGYVYKKTRGFLDSIFQKNKFEETRVSGVTVSLYYFDEEKQQWVIWDAERYKQQNPQETNQSGEFGFMVPAGRYYLDAQKTGYHSYKSEEFEVKDQIVNKNIEMEPVVSRGLTYLLIGLGLLILIIIFIFILRRRNP